MDILDDVVGALRVGQVQAGFHQVRSPWTLSWPRTESVAGFHLVVAGEFRVIRPGEAPLQLRRGGLAFFPRGDAHDLRIADSSGHGTIVCGAYDIVPGWRHPLLADIPPAFVITTTPTTTSAPGAVGDGAAVMTRLQTVNTLVATLATLIANEITHPRPGQHTMLSGLVDGLMLAVLREWIESPQAVGWARAVRDPALSRAVELMHSQPATAWTVESLAAASSMSRAGFARRFTELAGMPPMSYLTRWRLQLAAKRLRQTDASIKVIAREVGYASEASLSRAFTRANGMAPGAYRRQPTAPIAAAGFAELEPVTSPRPRAGSAAWGEQNRGLSGWRRHHSPTRQSMTGPQTSH